MIVSKRNTKATPCEPGVTRYVLAYSEKLMMCEILFEKGARGNLHAHPHEQVSYVKKGEFLFTVNGEKHAVTEGDSIIIPSEAEHGVLAVTEGTLIDVFTPMRETFV